MCPFCRKDIIEVAIVKVDAYVSSRHNSVVGLVPGIRYALMGRGNQMYFNLYAWLRKPYLKWLLILRCILHNSENDEKVDDSAKEPEVPTAPLTSSPTNETGGCVTSDQPAGRAAQICGGAFQLDSLVPEGHLAAVSEGLECHATPVASGVKEHASRGSRHRGGVCLTTVVMSPE